MAMAEDRQFLRREEAAAYLQRKYGVYTVPTLAKLAVTGGGPPFQRFSRFPVYKAEDLDAWATARLTKTVTKTCELAAT
jgi:hypothetical protein